MSEFYRLHDEEEERRRRDEGVDEERRHHDRPGGDDCDTPGGQPDIELYDLIDFTMQVGNTGLNFVAGLTGWRERDGTALFITGATSAAYRRAASTLAQM